MLINPDALTYWINNFYGYGAWTAPIWFVSYEEPGGDLPEEVAERINFLSGAGSPHTPATPLYPDRDPGRNADQLCNIRELYSNVLFRGEGPRSSRFENQYDYRFGDQAVLHGIWKNLIAFVHGEQGIDTPDLLRYQQEVFASPIVQREALIPLYPLPSPHDHAWYYSWLDIPSLPFIKVRTTYESYVYDNRMRTIMGNLAKYKPRTVLMYEMNNINKLKNSVMSFYPNVSFKMIKAVKGMIPQHHRAQLGSTTLLITTQVPALKHNRKETGFDWNALGKMASRS